jgi:hypothetical protein
MRQELYEQREVVRQEREKRLAGQGAGEVRYRARSCTAGYL